MRLQHVDLFFLHGYLVGSEHDGGERRTPLRLFEDAVRPAFERLVDQGRIGAWGSQPSVSPAPYSRRSAASRAQGRARLKAKRVWSASSSSSPAPAAAITTTRLAALRAHERHLPKRRPG
jgi:hypothetical protein